MTFTLPEDLVAELLRRVAAQDRSRYVAEAIASRLRERDERLIHSCEVANRSTEVRNVEEEWGPVRDDTDRLEEPWNNDASPR